MDIAECCFRPKADSGGSKLLPCNVPCEPHFTRRMGHLAAGHSKLENFDVAVRLLDDAIQIAERTNERFVEAELHRLRAEALQSSGLKTDAEAALQRALAISRTQQAKFWELRAATSLVQFWRDKGNLHQAGALLRPIYKWFTEDHDLPDLRDAKALLDALPACEQKRA